MCLLQDSPFDQSKTKMVYKVIYDGLPWVFNIGAGEGCEGGDSVEQGCLFLKRFVAESKRKGVDIEQGIQVTDFELGVGVAQDDSGPLIALGFSKKKYQAACEAQTNSDSDPGIIIWLFEPRRSSKVKH
ncbi:hypothetical protein B0H13DRAFT_1875508 [Mycena leptocephala]|nr:hypothetical protein B0H13DRAFT_1875508 [Mycena leptocephala]